MNKILSFYLAIVIAAFSIRLYDLSVNPLDFDESIHAFISFILFEHGIYEYNPTTHGPFLFYVTAGTFHVLGDNILAARLMPAVFGGLMVLLLLPLRRYFGDVKFLIMAAMMAFSHSFIVYSRELRHDIFLSFFILGFIVCIMMFLEKQSTKYLYLGFASLVITMAIKPTTYIFIFTLVIFGIYYISKNTPSHAFQQIKTYLEIFGGHKEKRQESGIPETNLLRNYKVYLSIIYLVLIFIAINYLFYNSISDGIVKPISSWLFQTYLPEEVRKPALFPPFYYYAEKMLKLEFLIFIAGSIGSIYYLLTEKNYFTTFCSFWGLISLIVLSGMWYKTHELILNILLPFLIIAGYFLGDIIEKSFHKYRQFFVSSIIVILIVSLYINNPLPATAENEYDKITGFIEVNNDDQKNIYFMTRSINLFTNPWPLPWYLREYNLYQHDTRINITQKLTSQFGVESPDQYNNIVYETRPILIASTPLPQPLEDFGYNSTHFEVRNIYVYY